MIDFSTSNTVKEHKMKLVIGIDVSKKKLDLSVYDDKKHKLLCVKNEKTNIEVMLKDFDHIKDT